MNFRRFITCTVRFPNAVVLAVLLLTTSLLMTEASSAPQIYETEWTRFTDRFVGPDGRVIDNANGNISHSESQGYGLLLAYLAEQPADFQRIWAFTQSEMLVRDDGLAAWRWEPDKTPHISDINNATDGDILISYALALAGRKWRKVAYLQAAARIATGILSQTVKVHGSRTILLPAVDGFSSESRPDGPVINPSYLIFEAFPVLDVIVPSPSWNALTQDGLDLINRARFGPSRLPPEWLALGGVPKPAEGFDPVFSYNAIRIPLYLIRSGNTDAALLDRLAGGIAGSDGEASVVDLKTGQALEPLSDAGYRIIVDALSCITKGTPVQPKNLAFEPVNYYPAALQLLSLAYLREFHPDCV